MATTSPTLDPFPALADPRRREILTLLAKAPSYSVNELVDHLGLPQPAVSKHLGVLRKVGLVSVEKNGQQRFYALNAIPLQPVQAWLATFEQFWTHHLDDIKQAAEKKARARRTPPPDSN